MPTTGHPLRAHPLAFVEQVIVLVDSTIVFFRSDPDNSRANLIATLEDGRERIEVALGLLGDAGNRLEELRSGETSEDAAGVVRSLAEKVDASLGSIQMHADAFSVGIREIQEWILATRNRIDRALLRVAILGSVLLVWQAAAQASLAAIGRQMHQRRTGTGPLRPSSSTRL